MKEKVQIQNLKIEMDRLKPDWAVKMIVVLIVASILIRCVSATNITVGGAAGWELMSDLQRWSSMTIFYTGDSLVFFYGPNHDVLEVNERAFNTCRISDPIRAYNDGESVVLLDRAGTRYFICGTHGHCEQGMRMRVDVIPRPEAPDDDVERNRRRRRPPPGHHSRPHEPPTIEIPPSPTTYASPSPQHGSAARAAASGYGTCFTFISGLLFSSILPLTLLLVFGLVHSYA